MCCTRTMGLQGHAAQRRRLSFCDYKGPTWHVYKVDGADHYPTASNWFYTLMKLYVLCLLMRGIANSCQHQSLSQTASDSCILYWVQKVVGEVFVAFCHGDANVRDLVGCQNCMPTRQECIRAIGKQKKGPVARQTVQEVQRSMESSRDTGRSILVQQLQTTCAEQIFEEECFGWAAWRGEVQ